MVSVSALVFDHFNVTRLLRNAFRNLVQDLKWVGWLRGFGWFAGFIWFAGLVTSATYIGVATLASANTACLPDGSFRLQPLTYSMWSSSGFFQITLGGGHLTFAEAKVVDIVWDIGVGRGGQFLLALLSWRVFARYLTICMESEPVTYQLFRTIFLENEASLLSTFRTIKNLIWHRRLRSTSAMIFMVCTMVFILAFPTLTSAMSGYDSNVASYMPDTNDNLIQFTNFSRVLYVIHDGWRVNQSGNYWITDYQSFASDPVLDGRSVCSYYRHRNYSRCNVQNSVSAYVTAHGLGGIKNESTRFDNWTTGKNFTLPGPALNISAYASEDNTWGGQNSSVLEMAWLRGNETFNRTYVQDNGSCQSVGDYQWGFSFLQLFICIILLLVWTIGIYTMWLRAHYTMALRNRHPDDISGAHRAVIELAAAMHEELDIKEIDLSILRENHLKERVDSELKGGTISYAYSEGNPENYSFRKGIKPWLGREKWWLLAMVITSVLFSTIWMALEDYLNIFFWFWFTGVIFGQFWAFLIGTTTGSRFLIILFWSTVSAIIVTTLFFVYYR